jgi:hypothetical protein
MYTYDSDLPLHSTSIHLGTNNLRFGYFNQPLKRYDIHESVNSLTFGYRFNQILK